MLVSMTTAAPFAAASLCVAGNLNRDLRIAPVAPGGYLFQDGETSVPFIRETTGGGGANTACRQSWPGSKDPDNDFGAGAASESGMWNNSPSGKMPTALVSENVPPSSARRSILNWVNPHGRKTSECM
jgi:hypothetical protein